MSNSYRGIVNDSINGIENIIDNIEEKIVDINNITKSILEEDVSDEVNSKIGLIEEIIDNLLYELK